MPGIKPRREKAQQRGKAFLGAIAPPADRARSGDGAPTGPGASGCSCPPVTLQPCRTQIPLFYSFLDNTSPMLLLFSLNPSQLLPAPPHPIHPLWDTWISFFLPPAPAAPQAAGSGGNRRLRALCSPCAFLHSVLLETSKGLNHPIQRNTT